MIQNNQYCPEQLVNRPHPTQIGWTKLSRVNEEPKLNLVGEEPGGITSGRETNARLRLPTDMNGKLILVWQLPLELTPHQLFSESLCTIKYTR